MNKFGCKKLVFLQLLALFVTGCRVTPNREKQTKTATQSITSAKTSSSSSEPSPSSSVPSLPLEKTKLDYTYDDYQAHNFAGADNCPLSGHPKLLVIPVWFNDSTTFISESSKELVRNDIETSFVGSNEETGWRSVKTFYEEDSLGVLSLEATVSEWYSITSNYTAYGTDSNLTKTRSLIDNAVAWYFENNPTDQRSNYDSNADGFMDGVMLVYAAPDCVSLENTKYSNLWAYCYWTDNKANVDNPTAKSFFWASYDFMYDSMVAMERTGTSPYGGGDCRYINIDAHTYIHEMGHVLGLDDYCDKGGLFPAGGFSMQDYAMGGHDAYSVMALGWAEPYIPTSSNTITIHDFASSHDVILLANHEVNSTFDEYILIELFTPTGLNQLDCDHAYDGYPIGPSKPGIRVWHVDARLTYVKNMTPLKITYSSELITNPDYPDTDYGIYSAMANSYSTAYASVLGSNYYNYNLLQLIRNDEITTYRPDNWVGDSDLFYAGDTFSMQTYKNQFYKTGKMNNDQNLGWSFTVNSISNNQAEITIIKE